MIPTRSHRGLFWLPAMVLGIAVLAGLVVMIQVRLPGLRLENQRKAEETNLRLAGDAIAYRLISRVRMALQGLAASPELVALVVGEEPPDAPGALRVMTTTRTLIRADIVYAMNRSGTVVGSTLYGDGGSLTGNNYGFRPYFSSAMSGHSIVYPAVGVTTKRRGLYFSAPILREGASDVVGVVVVKMGLAELDWVLDMFASPACLLSEDGVVFASNQDDWLYRSIAPLSDRVARRLQESQQFADIRIVPLPYGLSRREASINGVDVDVLSVTGPFPGWRLISCVAPDFSFPLSTQQVLLVRLLVGVALLVVLTAVVVLVNINMRRRAQQRYRDLVVHMSEGIMVARDEQVIFCNDRLGEMLGCSRAELASASIEKMVHPDDRAMAMAYHRARLASEDAPERYEMRLVHRNGSPVWVLASAVQIPWEGRPAVLVFLVDVSEQKKLQTRLGQAARMEAIGQLAGGIAHDFNNLLVGILGNAEILRHKLPESDESRCLAEAIELSAKRAAELTGQLLGFARRGRHLSEPVDFHELIRQSAELLDRTMGKRVDVVMQLKASEPHVLGDPSQLKQIVLNLGVNARDAMPDGGRLTITTSDITAAQARARGLPAADADWFELCVSDTGCGIPEQFAHRVFEPFFTTKGAGKGTGMGLAMIYGIVSNHNGTIALESPPGQGATFIVCLPRCKARKVPAQSPAPSDDFAALRDRTVFVVDDESIVLNVASSILRDAGCKVRVFDDAADAVEAYAHDPVAVDVVVLDMEMPGVDGAACFARLKEVDPDVRVLLSTGYGLNGKAQQLLDAGMLGLVQKPYSSAELCSKLRDALLSDA